MHPLQIVVKRELTHMRISISLPQLCYSRTNETGVLRRIDAGLRESLRTRTG